MEDDIISGLEFAENKAPRLPCVVVVDGSGSMEDNDAISQLNDGLRIFERQIKANPKTATGVRLKVIRVGGTVETLVDWTDAMNFVAPVVTAYGRTPLGAGVRQALKDIEDEKGRIDAAGVIRKRAWLFILTDGEPTDAGWEGAAEMCRRAESENKASVFCIGVDNANTETLGKFSNRSVSRLSSRNFEEFFVWLSKSAEAGAVAGVGETAQLPARDDWATA